MENARLIHRIKAYSKKHCAKWDDDDIQRVISADCRCSRCGTSIFDMDDYPYTSEDEYDVICTECYDEVFSSYCECCENRYEERYQTEKFIVFTPAHIENNSLEGIKAGIYRVKKYPIFYGNIVSGFDGLFNENIELVRECDIDSMITKIHGSDHEQRYADSICQDCAEKFALITPLAKSYVQYIDTFTRVHFNVNERAILKQGK